MNIRVEFFSIQLLMDLEIEEQSLHLYSSRTALPHHSLPAEWEHLIPAPGTLARSALHSAQAQAFLQWCLDLTLSHEPM